MFNIRTKAIQVDRGFALLDVHGDVVATFTNEAFFFAITGFKTVDAYNDAQDEKPTKFYLQKRAH